MFDCLPAADNLSADDQMCLPLAQQAHAAKSRRQSHNVQLLRPTDLDAF